MKKYAGTVAVILIMALLFSSYALPAFAQDGYVESGDFIFSDNGNNTLTLKKYKGKGGQVDVPAMVGGKKVVTIGYDSFGESYDSTPDSKRITKVTLPVTVTTVEKMAFLECTKLSDISMTGVKTVDDGAFWDCKGLKRVAVSAALKKMGENVFGGKCGKLKLYCEKGSYAESYAKANSISYSALYPEKIVFSKSSYSVSQGKSINVGVKVIPSDSYYSDVYLYSAGKYTSVLSQDGDVKGIKVGKEKIKCIAHYGNAKAECTVNVKIPTVGSIKASKTDFTSITLSWSKAKKANGYRLEMKSGGKWKKLTETEKTSFKVKNLSPETQYSFRIRSYADKNGKTKTGDWVTFSASTLKIGKVTGVKANPTSDGYLSFSWQKAANAKKYVIYSVDKNGNVKKLEETKELSYTAKSSSGTVKSYKVRGCASVNKKKVYGAYSNAFTLASPPETVSGLSVASKGKTNISIKWNKVKNADGYSVYTVKDGKYTLVKNTTATSWSFSGLKTNTSYTYAVCAYVNTSLKTVCGKYSTVTVKTDPLYSTAQLVESDITAAFKNIKKEKEFYVSCQKKVNVSVTSCSGSTSDRKLAQAYANMFSTNETFAYDFVGGIDQRTEKTPSEIFVPERGFSLKAEDIKTATKEKDGSGYRETVTLKSETATAEKAPPVNSRIWGMIDRDFIADMIKEDASLESFIVTYTATAINIKVNSKGTFDDYSVTVPFEIKTVCDVNGSGVETVFTGKLTYNYTLTWW